MTASLLSPKSATMYQDEGDGLVPLDGDNKLITNNT